MIDAKQSGILNAVKLLLADLYIPAVSKSSDWGELSEKDALPSKMKFLTSLENFVEILSGAQDSLEDSVNLKECDGIDLSKFFSPSTYPIAANTSEILESVENQATGWIKQIEQVTSIFILFTH